MIAVLYWTLLVSFVAGFVLIADFWIDASEWLGADEPTERDLR